MIKSKLEKTGTSIFTKMSSLAARYDAINLSQGFPDFPVSAKLIDLVTKHMKQGHNQYAPMQGLTALRQGISEKVNKLYESSYDPDDEITITAGATQAIYTAITAVVREGDEVIVFDPSYDCYVPAIELNGGIAVRIRLMAPDFSIDTDELRKRVSSKTKMIIINNPHNPTGAVISEQVIDELIQITEGRDIVILSDEVYEHLVYDGIAHSSVCRFPKLRERSFIVFSFGKTFHATGWKVGYCLAPGPLMREFRKVHQYLVFSVNTPMQFALADYIAEPSNYLNLPDFYQKKRDIFRNLISGSNFSPLPCSGSYFQLLDYSQVSDEDDVHFAERLTIDNGIASIPISVFYESPPPARLLRFCFAKTEEVLATAAEKLCSIEKMKS